LKFVAHHLWNPAKREAQRKHGMPQDVAESLREDGLLRSESPHVPATVRRRLSSWATLHRWRGIERPFASPALRSALRLAVQASVRPRHRKKAARGHARRARPVVRGLRGRRRSEAAGLRIEQLREERSVRLDPADGFDASAVPCEPARPKKPMGRAGRFWSGPPVEGLREWLQRATSRRSRCSGRSTGGAAVEDRALTPQSINLIVKRRCAMAGLDPRDYLAHRLRAGVSHGGGAAGDCAAGAMQQSQHRFVQQAASYYNEVDRAKGRAVR
jgi:hypothetical protein